jgi:hypothetical protein
MKTNRYIVLGVVPNYAQAVAMVESPGDCAIVERSGLQRQIVIRCPDGCGEVLSINLDPRSGPAWRLYERHRVWSLFPSIDRTTGCLSHFILWRGHILWCDVFDQNDDMEVPEGLLSRIIDILSADRSVSFVQLADELDEVPWDVLTACRTLVRRRVLLEGSKERRGIFSLRE